MGYSVIKCTGKQTTVLTAAIVNLSKLENQYLKLKKIYESVSEIIELYHPDELAIEAPFFGKNVQSMLKLGRAQGVCIAAALHFQLPVFEYAPRKIKQSITGNGNASKEQVALMLQTLLKFAEMPKFMDATDALAIALCHYYQSSGGIQVSSKSASSWGAFLKNNPERLK